MNITVYLGASEGADPTLREAVAEFGDWIARSGNSLVYGGSRSGLMGVLAESVVTAGGEATGVEPEFFMDIAVQYENLTRLIVTKDMTERKAKEIMSRNSLSHIDAPCILYNHNGYYEGLKQLLDTMVKQGLATEQQLARVRFADSVDELCAFLEE